MIVITSALPETDLRLSNFQPSVDMDHWVSGTLPIIISIPVFSPCLVNLTNIFGLLAKENITAPEGLPVLPSVTAAGSLFPLP